MRNGKPSLTEEGHAVRAALGETSIAIAADVEEKKDTKCNDASDSNTVTVMGTNEDNASGLGAAASTADMTESILVFHLLLRTGFLSSKRLCILDAMGETVLAGIPTHMVDAQAIRLLARVLSLLPFTMDGVVESEPWSGPIEREMSAFYAAVKVLRRSVRNVMEAAMVETLVEAEAEVGQAAGAAEKQSEGGEGVPLTADDANLLSYNLGFSAELPPFMGLLATTIITVASASSSSSSTEVDGDTNAQWAKVAQTFPQVKAPKKEWARCMTFWRAVMRVVTFVHDQGKELEIFSSYELFRQADSIVKNVNQAMSK